MIPHAREQWRDFTDEQILESRSGIRYLARDPDPDETMQDWAERMGYKPSNHVWYARRYAPVPTIAFAASLILVCYGLAEGSAWFLVPGLILFGILWVHEATR